MFMRPEDSIRNQNEIGSDIMMALDDVIKTTTLGPRVYEAADRTIRWLDRCFQAHNKKDSQNIFPIVQGGLDLELRRKSIEELVQRDANGFAIGGLCGGESKEEFWRVVHFCCERLPKDKPRYTMGVGYPEDLVICACLGVDMCDCVYPTRTARFGTVFTKNGLIRLKNAQFKFDFRPIDEECSCETCQLYTRSYLHTIVTREEVACHYLSKHNVHYLLSLMGRLRQSIIDGKLEEFVRYSFPFQSSQSLFQSMGNREFFTEYYKEQKEIPQWIHNALASQNLKI